MVRGATTGAGLVLLAGLVAGCSPSVAPDREAPAGATPTAYQPLRVFTVNYPLAYLAERVGGDRVAVVFPAPPQVDPADWSPDAETIAAFQSADLILLNGADYAKWVTRASLPSSRMVDTSFALQDRFVRLEGSVTHSHGPGGEHTHTGTAFTLWLDPMLALEQSRAIRDAFVEALPEGTSDFDAGFASLASDLRQLDADLAGAWDAAGKPPVLFSHPVYQYLVRRYGLDARSLHWEPAQMPDSEAWHGLEHLLAERPAVAMLWEDEPLPEVRGRLEEMGLIVLVYRPVSNRPSSGDWLSEMRANVERLSREMGTGTDTAPPQRRYPQP